MPESIIVGSGVVGVTGVVGYSEGSGGVVMGASVGTSGVVAGFVASVGLVGLVGLAGFGL